MVDWPSNSEPEGGLTELDFRQPTTEDSVWIRAFGLVLQHLSSSSVDTYLERLALALDIERVSQAGSAALFLKLLIGDLAGTSRKGSCACLRPRHFRQRQEIRSGKVAGIGRQCTGRAHGSGDKKGKQLTHYILHK